MLRTLLVLACVLAANSTHAQTPPAPHAHRTLQDRFDEANVTHDGHLTAEQARSRMPAVARDFTQIDTGNRGYVTVEDIKAHNREKRAAARAAKLAAAPAGMPAATPDATPDAAAPRVAP